MCATGVLFGKRDRSLSLAVCHVTGESLDTVRHLGFSEVGKALPDPDFLPEHEQLLEDVLEGVDEEGSLFECQRCGSAWWWPRAIFRCMEPDCRSKSVIEIG